MDLDEKKPAAPYSGRFRKLRDSKQASHISDPNPRQDKLQGRDPRPCGRPTYALKLRAEPGVDAIHALRAVLKNMLRRYGLRCLSAYEEKSGGGQ
jgi:hypothetical protein